MNAPRSLCSAIVTSFAISSCALAGDIPDLTRTRGVARAGLSRAKIGSIKCGTGRGQ